MNKLCQCSMFTVQCSIVIWVLTMNDLTYMRRALDLADQGADLTSPGAMVGPVIVKDGSVIGEGFYTWDRIRHAEIIALEQASAAARGATLNTSLEQCFNRVRTPPS